LKEDEFVSLNDIKMEENPAFDATKEYNVRFAEDDSETKNMNISKLPN
jgi:hypothetical protein